MERNFSFLMEAIATLMQGVFLLDSAYLLIAFQLIVQGGLKVLALPVSWSFTKCVILSSVALGFCVKGATMGNWLFFNYNNWKVLAVMALVIVTTGMVFGITILDFIVLVLIVFHYVFCYGLPKLKVKLKKDELDKPIKIRR